MLCTHSSSVLRLPKLFLLSREIFRSQQNIYISWWLSIMSQFLDNVQNNETRIRESENHKMIWFGRCCKNHLTTVPCHGEGHLPPDQFSWSPIQPGLEIPKRLIARLSWHDRKNHSNQKLVFISLPWKKSILLTTAGTKCYARRTSGLISATNFRLNKT